MKIPDPLPVLVLVLCSTAAFAQDPAEECAEGLSPNARLVFDAVRPELPRPNGDGEDFVRDTVRGMVMDGELPRRDARAAAQEAAECLQLLAPLE